jgi:bidirectional [NiFe] hydrogenase diaphorase subunit
VSEQPIAARPIRRRILTEEVHEGPVRAHAYVCEAASCMSAQAHEVTLRLGEAAAEAGLTDVVVKRVGCLGLCAAGPLVEIPETGRLFSAVTPDGVGDIVEALKTVKDTDTRQPQGPFFEKQLRVATENMGRVDPESLEDYTERGGYEALKTILADMTSTEVREATRRVSSGRRSRRHPAPRST